VIRPALVLVVLAGLNLGAAIAITSPAVAQADAFDAGTIREANELIKAKRYNEAVTKLAPLVPRLAGKPDFDTLYGIALLDAGRPQDAAVAFRRALAVDPGNLAARGHLGRSLAATGEIEDARREMTVVLERPNLPADLKEVIERNIAMLDDAKKKQTKRTGPQQSESDAAVIRSAAQLVRAKKATQALAKLEPLAERLAGNTEFDYVYGVASLEAGRPAQATTALRRSVEGNPNFTLARAELGRALAAMGDLAGAKREFEAVQTSGEIPSNVRNVIGQQITAIDQGSLTPSRVRPPEAAPAPTGPATRITGYFETGFGYDTNVNAGPTSDTLLIPAFAFLGPATLASSAVPKKSGFYDLGGGVSIIHAFTNELAVFANVVGNWHMLFQNQEFRTSLLGFEAGVARIVPGVGIFSVATVGQTYSMGDDTYRDAYGLVGQWRTKIGEWEPSVAFTWLRLTYPHMSMQNADRYTGTFALTRRLDLPLEPVVSISPYVGKEDTEIGDNNFLGYNFRGVRAGLELRWAPWLTSFILAGYEVQRYDADYPLFFYPRHDQLREYAGGFDIKLAENVGFRPTVRYYETRSNVDLFDSKRWIWQGALRWTY